jgi:hypothetical protein
MLFLVFLKVLIGVNLDSFCYKKGFYFFDEKNGKKIIIYFFGLEF